jgi:hypothetical protein
MNRRQIAVIWIGLLLVVGMGLVPPWRKTLNLSSGFRAEQSAGYALIWNAPEDSGWYITHQIDHARLIIQWVITGAVGLCIVMLLKSSVVPQPAAASVPPSPAPPAPPRQAAKATGTRWTTGPMSATERWSWVAAVIGWGVSVTCSMFMDELPKAIVGLVVVGPMQIAAGGAWHLFRERLRCRPIVGSGVIVALSLGMGLVGAFSLAATREGMTAWPPAARFAVLLPLSYLCFPLGGMIPFLLIRVVVGLLGLKRRVRPASAAGGASEPAANRMSDAEVHARAEAEVALALAQARALEASKPEGWKAERKRLRRYADDLRLLIGDDRYFAIERGAAPVTLSAPPDMIGRPPERLLWAPSGAAQSSAMFVEVAPGLPPTRGQYLALLGTKWTGIARSAGTRELQRFLSRVGSLFPSLPDGLTADTVGEALPGNDEVLEALSGQGLLAGMNQPVTADLHERLSDHGEPDLESILTVLENVGGSLE